MAVLAHDGGDGIQHKSTPGQVIELTLFCANICTASSPIFNDSAINPFVFFLQLLLVQQFHLASFCSVDHTLQFHINVVMHYDYHLEFHQLIQ